MTYGLGAAGISNTSRVLELYQYPSNIAVLEGEVGLRGNGDW